MPYASAWDEDVPSGGSDADQIDDRIRDLKTQLRERLGDAFGGMDEAEFSADPFVPKGFVTNGDLVAAGGYRQLIDGFLVTNVQASQTAIEIDRPTGRAQMLRAGSITGILASLNPSQVTGGGVVTVEVWKGVVDPGTGIRTDSATGLTTTIQSGHPAFQIATQAKDTDSFAAGDEVFVKYATDGSWTPNTLELKVTVEVEC